MPARSAGLAEGLEAAEAETGAQALIADIELSLAGGGPGHGQAAGRAARGGDPGTEPVIGVGLDSTELGVDPTDFADVRLAGKVGLRRTSHQGEETPPSHIWARLDVLGSERIDHRLSSLQDQELTRRLAGSGSRSPSAELERGDRQRRAAGAAPLPADAGGGAAGHAQHRRPGPHRPRPQARVPVVHGGVRLPLGRHGGDPRWTGVEATWLDESDKRELQAQVEREAAELGAELDGG